MISAIVGIFYLIALIFSVIIHELAHGYVAYFLGDLTAKYEKRLTLNPLSHLDPFGSIILPLLLFFLKSPVLFGWAKPVPINPYNFKDQKWGSFKVAIAGPASNITLALLFGIMSRLLPLTISEKQEAIGAFFGIMSGQSADMAGSYYQVLFFYISIVIFLNISLALFNLIPIPPLDGHWILFQFLPESFSKAKFFLQQYGMVILIFLIFFGGLQWLSELVFNIFLLITGI